MTDAEKLEAARATLAWFHENEPDCYRVMPCPTLALSMVDWCGPCVVAATLYAISEPSTVAEVPGQMELA